MIKHVGAVVIGGVLSLVICTSATAGKGRSAALDPEQIRVIQKRILDDPEMLPIILSLRNDPEMRKIVNDPEVAATLQAGDLSMLVNDPRFVQLLGKPQMRELVRRCSQ